MYNSKQEAIAAYLDYVALKHTHTREGIEGDPDGQLKEAWDRLVIALKTLAGEVTRSGGSIKSETAGWLPQHSLSQPVYDPFIKQYYLPPQEEGWDGDTNWEEDVINEKPLKCECDIHLLMRSGHEDGCPEA